MPLTTPRELFLHELADAMSAEQQILKMLPELQEEARNSEVREALQEHEAETRQQVENIQEVFRQFGETPETTTCLAMQGIAAEHQALHQEEPPPEILEMANLIGAAKTEHYEIASYAALVQMAKDLGEKDIAALLQETLTEEEAMSKRVTALAKAAGKELKASAAD